MRKRRICATQRGESDGYILVGIASGCVTNLSGWSIARSEIGNALRIRTQELVCPDASHRKFIFREKNAGNNFP
jgi:hypothetical protein